MLMVYLSYTGKSRLRSKNRENCSNKFNFVKRKDNKVLICYVLIMLFYAKNETADEKTLSNAKSTEVMSFSLFGNGFSCV